MQSFSLLSQSSLSTFAMQQDKANWRMIWILVLCWEIFSGLLGLVAAMKQFLITPLPILDLSLVKLPIAYVSPLSVALVAGIVMPLAFLTWMGSLYILARAFQGQGTFMAQCTTTLLFLLPLALLAGLLLMLPFGSGLCLALSGYIAVLQVFMVMGVHRVSKSNATVIVFLPVLLIAIPLASWLLSLVGALLLFLILGAYLLLFWDAAA